MGRLTIAEGKSLTSVAHLYVWTIPLSSSGRFIRDIIHVTALDFRHDYDKFTSVMTPRRKSLSIFLCFSVGHSVSAGRRQQVKLIVAGVDDVLFGPTGSAQAPHQYQYQMCTSGVQRGYDHVLQICSCTPPVCIVSSQDSHHCFFFLFFFE